ncbi:MAG: decarboxylating 6-phosphogluconate dehydrogenase [Prosthecochloris sp.]|uniref:6-phosphogluconate dehydrogenase, decarboxylating n=1 Tax=Prosthecochloris aestuarii (strain DSM 271 / SK 413) TaxID=290512 RepID=B4S4M3_PROA2|nr:MULTISPECIES: decarboxylating 6-phosphogluconate dehydrogenase [Prosthecochloris]ACF46919.1 6-phosphogluconate dehydrogenase, decarboxylating [Prosthecochloris aestuarii DSM 271]MCW8798926.1 decarboxylating 6-phosphogluconate dehydrogenase [Prosthecochloris sp.]RDD29547.1 6-phosphogluconate dehydrogenase (decarboxylating) [Prosthecochloris sp. ZM]
MKTGFVGLGKMGLNMVENLLDHGHDVVVYDLSSAQVLQAVQKGAVGASSLKDLADTGLIWMMVPAGAPVDATIDELLPILKAGDIIIDGGNSNYHDTVRRALRVQGAGMHYLDVGTSGGLEGARNGACMMIGGSSEIVDRLDELFRDMCVPGGYGYVGPNGAGHFAKMVHNGVEYGMMQAIGEGFDILESAPFTFDHHAVAGIWSNGSVIRGWLMDLVAAAFEKDGALDYLSGEIADSGEGRWTIDAALDQGVSIPVIANALFRRYRSRSHDNFSDKVVAALRHEFGGHGFTPKS